MRVMAHLRCAERAD